MFVESILSKQDKICVLVFSIINNWEITFSAKLTIVELGYSALTNFSI